MPNKFRPYPKENRDADRRMLEEEAMRRGAEYEKKYGDTFQDNEKGRPQTPQGDLSYKWFEDSKGQMDLQRDINNHMEDRMNSVFDEEDI